MNILLITIATILLLVGSSMTLFLAWVLYAQSAQMLFGGRLVFRAKQAQKKLDLIDRLLADRDFERAIVELRKAPWIDIPSSHESVRAAREHNQNILSRALILCEDLGGRAENIAHVEQLFIQLSEAHLLYLKSNEAFGKIKTRRQRAGKNTPDWGKTDFSSRLSEVKHEIAKISDELRSSLDVMFNSIKTPVGTNVTYH
jgi:hypothetical protein